jgi:hypothetical protein
LATAAPVSAVATAANSRYTKIFRPISNDNAMGVNIIKPTNGELKQDGNQYVYNCVSIHFLLIILYLF